MRFLLAALLLCGCVADPTIDQGNGGNKPGPSPTPAATDISLAAEQSARDYETGLADTAADVARRIDSGELKDYPAVFTAYKSASTLVREKAMTGYEQKLTDRLKPAAGNFDKTKSAAAFREIEQGFRKRGATK